MSEAILDTALRDLGAHLAWSEEADLAPRVTTEIENVVPLPTRRRGRRVVLVAAAALLVLTALLAVSPGLRAAMFRLLGIRGAEVEVHETVSPPTGSPFAAELLGDIVTRAEAERELGFPLAFPSRLGQAEGVYLLGKESVEIATVTYRDGGLLFSQFRGPAGQPFIEKTVGFARFVEVNGSEGIWVEGPHSVFIHDPSGPPIELEPFVGGNTLLWSTGGVTFRLEGAVELSDALRIARTVAS